MAGKGPPQTERKDQQTETEHPYIILHENAAFLQCSGIPSNKFINRPLINIMTVPVMLFKSSLCQISNALVLVLLRYLQAEDRQSLFEQTNDTFIIICEEEIRGRYI